MNTLLSQPAMKRLGVALMVLTWASPVGVWAAAAPTGSASSVSFARGRVDSPVGIIQIAASREGIVKEVLVDEGTRVEKGTLLASLDDTSVRLNLALAERELEQARASKAVLEVRNASSAREVARLRKLVSEQLTKSQDLDEAQDRAAIGAAEMIQATSSIEAAKAHVDIAQYEVESRLLRAPVAGVIIRKMIRPGEGTSGFNVTPLFWLAPSGPLIVRADLEEDALRQVTVGQAAEITLEADPQTIYTGKVQKIGLFVGPKHLSPEDPLERQDVRVTECIVGLDKIQEHILIGQRVIVRFLPAANGHP